MKVHSKKKRPFKEFQRRVSIGKIKKKEKLLDVFDMNIPRNWLKMLPEAGSKGKTN
jgi:hypothetical protein